MRNKLIIILMFFCGVLFSQDNTFIRTFNVAGMNGGLALAVMEDGGFVGTGQHSHNGGTCYTYVYRIDECGNILWFNLYNSGGGGVSIDATSDSGVVISASNGNVIKIDQDGIPEWQRTFSPSFGGYVTSVIQTSDDGYLVGSQSGYLAKLDPVGNVIWGANLSGGAIHALGEFLNGDFMFYKYTNSDVHLGRVSSSGSLVWERIYYSGSSQDSHNDWSGEALIDTNHNTIIAASNTSLVGDGGVLVTQFDYNGNLLASNGFSSPGSGGEFVRSIDLTEHGGYIIGGGAYGFNTSAANVSQIPGLPPDNLSGRDILLFKVDTNINFQWSSVIGCSGSEKAIGVRTNKDNGYTISAYTDGAFFSAQSFDPLFIKTDSLGQVGCQQYSPILDQNSVTISPSTPSYFSPMTISSSSGMPSYFSISPSDYYMCLDCSTTPFFTISDTTLCVGDTTWFVNTSTGLICNQNWFVDGILISGPADSVPFVFSTPGLHNIKLETSCGATYVDYEIDFYVNNLKLYVTNISDYNSYEISCNGFNDGFIETYATSPFPPVIYNWSTANQDSLNQYNLYAGTYNLQLTDEFGCVFDTVFILLEPSSIISSYTVPIMNGYNVNCNGGQDGFIDLSVSGSVPVYSYQWSNGDTIEDINGLSAGTYSYVVTDQNGCITSDTIEIIEPTINIQESAVDVSCFGATNGSVSVNVSGSTAPYYVFWDNNINTTLVSSGTYIYQIVDSIGCVYFDSLIVSEPDSFLVTEGVVDVSCNGFNDGSISLVISGATPPFVVNWFGANIINAQAGTYNYTIVDSNNCYFSEIAIVNEPNQVDVLNQVVDPSCGNTNDGSVSLQISGGSSPYSVDWGGSNPNSLGIGSYVFVVTDDNNCVDSNTVTLTSVSNIQVVSEITQISCNSFCDGSIDLTITGGVSPYAVDWFGVNPAFLCEGSVSYEIVDAVGCYYAENFQIISPDSVELSISQLGMQLEANASGGVAPYSYEWFNDFGSLVNSQTVNITSNGSYYCIAIDVNHCQSDTVEYYYSETSIEDLGVTNLNIYPNPTDNILNIEFESVIENDFSLYFIDVLGQKIMIDRIEKFKGNYTYKLDLQRFSQGIYIFELRSGSEIYNKKVIKK